MRILARAGAAVLALFTLFQATWLLHGGVDLLFPRVKPVHAGADFRCAPHGCGCDSEAQMRKGCCCFPAGIEGGERAAPPSPVPMSALEEARCAGWAETLAQLHAQPVLPALSPILLSVPLAMRLLPCDTRPSLPVGLSALDKVPIA